MQFPCYKWSLNTAQSPSGYQSGPVTVAAACHSPIPRRTLTPSQSLSSVIAPQAKSTANPAHGLVWYWGSPVYPSARPTGFDSAAFLVALLPPGSRPPELESSALPRVDGAVTSYKSFARTPFWQLGMRTHTQNRTAEGVNAPQCFRQSEMPSI